VGSDHVTYLRNFGNTVKIIKEDRFPDIVFKRFAALYNGNIEENGIKFEFPENTNVEEDIDNLLYAIENYDWFTLTAEEKYLENEKEIEKDL